MLLYILALLAVASPAVVKTPYGPVRGFDFTTFSGKDVEVYLGIPFAKPPVGALRFEKPEIVDKWTDELSATNFGPSCYVHQRAHAQNRTYSEDCLTINVITPKERSEEKLPVLVFIHGGGFGVGDAPMVGYRHVADNFVARGDMVFVSIQYRLGFLAFPSNGDSTLPGNLGLWDQALALKFIKEIVPSFGGDAERITISGQSAGSASVSAMLVSPHANKYFSQAVQMSGSLFSQWVLSENVVKLTSELSEAVGCDFNNKATLKACLKTVSIEAFYDAMDSLGTPNPRIEFMSLHPHYDGDFFPEPIDVLLKKAQKKNTIQGVTDDESTAFALHWDQSNLYIPDDKRESYSKADLKEFIRSITLQKTFGSDHDVVKSLALDFYSGLPYSTSAHLVQAYCDLLSDLQFTLPVYHEVQQKIKFGWEPYVYILKHPRSKVFNATSIINGELFVDLQLFLCTLHGDELPFIMEFFGLEDIPLRPVDKEFKEVILDTFIAFVKTGNPSTTTVTWKPARKGDEDLHLILSAKPELTSNFFRKEAAKLWLETMPSQIGVDKLRRTFFPGLSYNPGHNKGEL